jgi:hypothetical protein
MKLETYLNAMEDAIRGFENCDTDEQEIVFKRYWRQYYTFRARILRMYDDVQEEVDVLWRLKEQYDKDIAEKDEAIHYLDNIIKEFIPDWEVKKND